MSKIKKVSLVASIAILVLILGFVLSSRNSNTTTKINQVDKHEINISQDSIKIQKDNTINKKGSQLKPNDRMNNSVNQSPMPISTQDALLQSLSKIDRQIIVLNQKLEQEPSNKKLKQKIRLLKFDKLRINQESRYIALRVQYLVGYDSTIAINMITRGDIDGFFNYIEELESREESEMREIERVEKMSRNYNRR